MAGVTGPMLRESPRRGIRFLLGLAAGAMAGGLVVAVVAFLVGTALVEAVPAQGRLLVLAAVCAALSAADLSNRTPHVWRQVPQGLVRTLPSGLLGTVWGFDIGVLFSTQKLVSLIWVALAAAVLLEPAAAPVLLVGMAALMSGTIALRSAMGDGDGGVLAHGSKGDRARLRTIRVASGAALLVLCVATATQALQM